MQIPYEFEQFVKAFYPGSGDNAGTLDEWIAANLDFMNETQRAVLKRFLDELLDGAHGDADIELAWRSQSPSYDFKDGGHRPFLTLVRSML